MDRKWSRVSALGLAGAVLIGMGNDVAATSLWQAIQNGKPDLYMRYRFEHVDDAQLPAVEDAYANTLRTALGYNTGLFHGLGAYLQVTIPRQSRGLSFCEPLKAAKRGR